VPIRGKKLSAGEPLQVAFTDSRILRPRVARIDTNEGRALGIPIREIRASARQRQTGLTRGDFLANPERIPSKIQDRKNLNRIRGFLVVNPKRKAAREHPVKS
jgi:hypothetical protein